MFSRTDKVTDSERFYTSLFDMLDDTTEKKEVEALLGWWNRYMACSLCYATSHTSTYRRVFPHVSPEAVEVPIQGSALDRIRQKRAEQELARDTPSNH